MNRKQLASIAVRLNAIVLGILCVLFGLAFAASPAYDFIKRMEAKKIVPPEQKADVDTIMSAPDQFTIRNAVDRLLGHDDVARVQVIRGEYDYPDFEITIGKTKTPRNIASSVYFNGNETRVYIAYFAKSEATKTIWDELRAMQPGGSFILGLIMIGFGVVVMFAKDQRQQHAEEKAKAAPPPPPPPAPPETTPPPEAERKYQGLRLV